LISTLLPNACATRINVPIVRFRGSSLRFLSVLCVSALSFFPFLEPLTLNFQLSTARTGRRAFVPFLRTNLISTLLPNACATRINVPIVRFRGSFSIAEIFDLLRSLPRVTMKFPFLNQTAFVPADPNARKRYEND
jgi:hypothetical protein